jgi:hypothetical protein
MPTRRFDLVVFIWLLVALGLSVCGLLNSRFWWQDVIASLTLAWLPIIVVGLFVTLYRFASGRTPVITGITALLVMGAVIGREMQDVLRMYRAPKILETQASVPFSIAFVPGAGSNSEAAIEPMTDVAIFAGEEIDIGASASMGAAFPFSAVSSAGRCSVVMRSKHPFIGEPRVDFGVGSLAAILARVQVGKALPLRVGALYLEPPLTRDAFERSKTTARRLATFVKDGVGPVVIAGAFFASPFSRTPGMFSHHVGLRSALWGRGMLPTWRPSAALGVGFTASNFYFSRSIALDDFKPLEWQGEHRPFVVSMRLPPDKE